MSRTGTPGRLVVISGPSGVGKGTVIAELRRRRPDLALSVSWTTRPPRPAEQDGVHYRFVTHDEFLRARDQGEFVEWEEYRGHLYGTPWTEMKRATEAGRTVLLEIDVRGAGSIQSMFPEAVTIFLYPASLDVLEQRLRKRGTDTDEQIQRRLEAAREELELRDSFQHPILNDRVDAVVDRIEAILSTDDP